MLGRTIDKLRASLPGGNMGDYKISGLSSSLLAKLGIQEDDLRAVIAVAATEDEVIAWVQRHSDASKYPEINTSLETRTVGRARERAEFLERYPHAVDFPAEMTLFDMLELDDRRSFAGIA